MNKYYLDVNKVQNAPFSYCSFGSCTSDSFVPFLLSVLSMQVNKCIAFSLKLK